MKTPVGDHDDQPLSMCNGEGSDERNRKLSVGNMSLPSTAAKIENSSLSQENSVSESIEKVDSP